MAEPNKTTGITAEERRLRSERLKSRLMGICEGFDAGAAVDAKTQEDEIARLEAENSRHKEQNAESKKHLDAIATVVCRREGQHGWTYVPCTLADEIRTMRDENSRLTQELDEALKIVVIAEELICFVCEKYAVTSLDGFTCPIHRRLAEAFSDRHQRLLTRTQSTPVAEPQADEDDAEIDAAESDIAEFYAEPQADPVREKDYGICDCPDPQSCNEQCAWSTWSTRFQKPSEGRQADPVREEREKWEEQTTASISLAPRSIGRCPQCLGDCESSLAVVLNSGYLGCPRCRQVLSFANNSSVVSTAGIIAARSQKPEEGR